MTIYMKYVEISDYTPHTNNKNTYNCEIMLIY